MKAKVCILAAGIGKRLGPYSEILNKALLPLRGRAIISHIIDKFSIEDEFVIAIGYKSQQVIDYLRISHPEHNFTFVEVSNFAESGSGPGFSALCCKNFLLSPFYLVCCDTLWLEEISTIPIDQNWIAVAEATLENSASYCNALVTEDKVSQLYDKIALGGPGSVSFTGLAFINNTDLFWQGLELDISTDKEKQLAPGFKNLIQKNSLYFHKISWTDVGTNEKYVNELKKTEHFDFSKKNEFIYIFNHRVIKFFQSSEVADLRVKKCKLNNTVFPLIEQHRDCFYSYTFQNGETLYKHAKPEVFEKLIEWLDKSLWIKKSVDSIKMSGLCKSFYEKKTYERLGQFEKKYPLHDQIVYIDGKKIPTARELLGNLSWDILMQGKAYFIHGDLQPDNIIYDEHTNQFLLLDWRQEFAGEIEFGDIYYDFAKLWGGLYLNYDQIKLNNFNYIESLNSCELIFPSHPFMNETQAIIETYLRRKNYSLVKVKLLVGLIYLNMSPLHHPPFDKLLHALGRKVLSDIQTSIKPEA